MFRSFIALALCALAVPALAQTSAGLQPTPKFKRAVTVTGDVVRIGDLIEDAGAVADVAVFRAPDLGSTGSVAAARVLDAVRQHNLLVVNTDGIGAIEVRRATRVLSARDIEARIARAIAGQYGLPDSANYAATFDNGVRPVHLDPSAVADLQVARVHFDARSSRFDVTFNFPGNARAQSFRFTGMLIETSDAVSLTRPVGRGETIRASDIVVERRAKTDVTADMAGGSSDVVGMAARQPLRAGQPLRRADLMKPEIVKRDEMVTIVFEVPGILLTTRGKAVESGAEGDMISVLNVQSKRTVQGTVTGPGRVTILSATPVPSTDTAAVYSPPAPFSTE